jgi:hypothetical protein
VLLGDPSGTLNQHYYEDYCLDWILLSDHTFLVTLVSKSGLPISGPVSEPLESGTVTQPQPQPLESKTSIQSEQPSIFETMKLSKLTKPPHVPHSDPNEPKETVPAEVPEGWRIDESGNTVRIPSPQGSSDYVGSGGTFVGYCPECHAELFTSPPNGVTVGHRMNCPKRNPLR